MFPLATTDFEMVVYAYIPTPNGLCKQSGIDCNDDFGISIKRGAFGFLAGS